MPLTVCFAEYKGGPTPAAALEFVRTQFLRRNVPSAAHPKPKPVHCSVLTSTLDSGEVKRVMSDVFKYGLKGGTDDVNNQKVRLMLGVAI